MEEDYGRKKRKNKNISIINHQINNLIIEFILSIICTILLIVKIANMDKNEIGLGEVVITIYSVCVSIALIFSVMAAICGLRYYFGKNNGKLTACWIWGIISLVANLWIMFILNDVEWDIITNIIFLTIFILPNALYLKCCYDENKKITQSDK